MAITAAQLVAQVSVQGDAEAKAKLQGVGQEVTKTGERAKEAGGGLSGMFKNALAFAGGQAIFAGIGFLKDQIGGIFTESMNAADELAQTNAALKSTHGIAGVTAQSVLDLATNFSHLTKFSDDTVQTGENILLTFTNIGKNIFPQTTAAVLDFAQAMHIDVNTAAMQVGKALQDPVAGVTALQREGVRLSPALKQTVIDLVATGHAADAQKIILKELQREFGGSAVAAGKTLGGQMAILGQRMDDVKQTIGDALMPVLASLLQKIGPIVDAFSKWVASGHAVSDVIATFTAHASVLIPILTGIGAVLLGGLIAAVWSLAAGVIAATWPFLAIGAAIAGVTAIFMHFYQTNAGFKAFIDLVVSGLRQAASFIQANFIPGIQIIWSVIQSKVLPALQQFGNWLSTQGTPILGKFASFMKEQVIPAVAQLVAAISTALTWILTHWTQIWGLLGPILQGVWNVISGVVKVYWALVSGIIKIGLDILRGNWKAVWEDIKKLLGGVLDGIGTIVRGFVQIIGGLFSILGTVVRGKFDEIKNNAVSTTQNLVNSVVSFFQSLPGRAIGALSGLVGMLSGFFGGLANQALTWGANIIANLASGIINNIGGAIGGAMSAVGQFIHDHLPSSPAKIGPLRDLATQGSHIPEEISKGIMSGIPKLAPSLNLALAPQYAAPMMAGASGGSGGQQSINVNVYLNGRALTSELMPHIVSQIRSAVGTISS